MKLLEPIKINNMEVPNRMVVSAMVTQYCREDGFPTEKYIAYHERKAKGGWGLIITEDYAIQKGVGGFRKLPGLWEDAQIPAHRELTERVHRYGSKIIAQIYHAGRTTNSKVNGLQIVGPSSIQDPASPEIPHELTVDEIKEIVRWFGDCARRAKESGFDGVEIHGASGYLVGQFLSPFSNHRVDEYGGDIIGRTRFAVEIIKDIREKCGQDFVVGYRMSVEEYVPGGLSMGDVKTAAMIFEKAGIDVIHCTQGIICTALALIPPASVPKAAYQDNAAAIKSVVSIPVIAAGRINDPLIAESILQSEKADLCTMARASLADPDLPNKTKEGRFEEINHCIACLQGCSGENKKGHNIRCLVNPMTGMEDEYRMEPAETRKNIVIVGAGVAGCEAAIVAAMRGHKVTVIEKEGFTGGQWKLASVPIAKGEFSSFVSWQKTMMNKLGVEIVLNTEATKEVIESYHPDEVVNAAGSIPAMPPIKGLREYAVNAREVLAGKVQAGQNVIVIGGGLVGAETADFLATYGRNVKIIELLPSILNDGEPIPNKVIMQRMKENHVEIITSAAVQTISENSVTYLKNEKEYTVEPVDTVIVAIGGKPVKAVETMFENNNIPVHSIGDADKVKSGYFCIREGYELGLRL